MKNKSPQTIYLKDYTAPDFWIKKTELHFDLFDDFTLVTSTLKIERNSARPENLPLILDGQELKLVSISIDGVHLKPDKYQIDDESLSISDIPGQFELVCVTQIEPQKNTSLEGLYKSRTMFCTQCEAQGFRKITYYLDRPDVLSEFITTVCADKSQYPILLSNGNLIETNDIDDRRHFATWHDPFKKPAYLFALVAGDLNAVNDSFETKSGRDIDLKIYVEEKDLDKCAHAMRSLKKAMKWDEQIYGREYDLEIFMIVAVDDFNMGAMENKGLNIFNTSCVLANPNTTTDQGFARVEAVVAHEYFHNWSGNRVTCRDWFQLSLKEGFTVFRDAEFSADMGSRVVKRVEDVSLMRTAQFAEDAGPMAHPVQPNSFMEISNFYTLTVYEKGAEVVRMIQTLIGAECFRKGSDLYFSRHDGNAVTIEDFVAAMESASGKDLSQFMYWYRQAGTPTLRVEESYDAQAQTYTLNIAQTSPDTPEAKASTKKPFHIPLALGLLGKESALALDDSGQTHSVYDITEYKQCLTFSGIKEKPVPSLLRNFSAPVKLDFNYSREDLRRLMAMDDDGFSRWDASQQLALLAIKDCVSDFIADKKLSVDQQLLDGIESILKDKSLDRAMLALMLNLPTHAYISQQYECVNVEAIHYAREHVKQTIAERFHSDFLSLYNSREKEEHYQYNAQAVASRSLSNTVLGYLMRIENAEYRQLCVAQFENNQNMTDVSAALRYLVNSSFDSMKMQKSNALSSFYGKWKNEALVINLWLSIQASSPLPDTLDNIKKLMRSDIFDINNPNKVRSLLGAFASNAINFHAASGEGYQFLADAIIELNLKNPQIAARLISPLSKWRRYDSDRQDLMRTELERIKAQKQLSKDVYEVVEKSLI